jgi:hypothetical protein
VAESDQLRGQFAAESTELQSAAAWIETGYLAAKLVRDWWPLFATGAGFLMTRKRRGWLRLLARALSLWRIVRRIFPLWKEFFSEKKPAENPTS